MVLKDHREYFLRLSSSHAYVILVILSNFGLDLSWNSGVPPGARFDPYGPPGFPDFDPDFARYMKLKIFFMDITNR